MYAIVEIKGFQYRAQKNAILRSLAEHGAWSKRRI